ncbi:hypothetical protein MNBD_GAMMA12-3466 [hydrothermal vent metagenome]|uniref:Uncharacterized protein n=1 Tax=hydrothermal vent metagenome TaxID=652676 RepID=A0A3B0YWY6_9ZZZZ
MNKKIKTQVLKIFRDHYPGSETDAQILKIDPNSFDVDPEGFYEALIDEFSLDANLDDEDDACFSGLGGKVSATIKFIEVNYSDRPSNNNADPLEQMDLLFCNIALGEKGKKFFDRRLRSCLDMFKYELRSEFKVLKQEAASALKLKQYVQILKCAKTRKVKELEEKEVPDFLNTIINY